MGPRPSTPDAADANDDRRYAPAQTRVHKHRALRSRRRRRKATKGISAGLDAKNRPLAPERG
eukprot:14872697-Alexandrium_andersonii.AAC.1